MSIISLKVQSVGTPVNAMSGMELLNASLLAVLLSISECESPIMGTPQHLEI